MSSGQGATFARALRIAAFLTTLGLAAVAVRVLGRPPWLPPFVQPVLDAYLEPGVSIWWFTLAGPFRHFPTDMTGYVVTVVGTVAFWCCAIVIGRRALGALRRRQ